MTARLRFALARARTSSAAGGSVPLQVPSDLLERAFPQQTDPGGVGCREHITGR